MQNRRQLFRTLFAGAAALSTRAADTDLSRMIVRSRRPEDFEMPLDGFSEWITPVERFYVRTHTYTPKVEVASWKLSVSGSQTLSLNLDDIRKMPKTELVSVMECAGNGRAFYDPPVRGVQWAYGSVGNGRWAGVRVRDVLAGAGVKSDAKHLIFNGADVGIGSQPDFQRSIPIEKAMHPDTLLAYEMNGAPLTPSHGYPLRLVVPSWAGDSWCKWVTDLKLSPTEADTFYMKSAYRHPGKPVTPGKAIPAAEMQPVQTLAVKSVIATPLDGDRTPSGPIKISGVAWSGAAPIQKVEVSVDRGRTWQLAALGRDQAQYAWRLWSFDWTPKQNAHYVVMARATDRLGNTQPFAQEWNPSGYLYNAVQQVAVEYGVPKEKPVAGQTAGNAEAIASKYEQPHGFSQSCLTCHEEDIIMQQRLSRVQWADEVGRMEAWGAKVNPADREGIVDYLYKLYGPRPRP